MSSQKTTYATKGIAFAHCKESLSKKTEDEQPKFFVAMEGKNMPRTEPLTD